MSCRWKDLWGEFFHILINNLSVPCTVLTSRPLYPFSPLQADVSSLQRQFQHQPLSASIDQSLEVLAFMRGKVPEPSSSSNAAGTSMSQPRSGDRGLLEDLVAMGDGGLFMDRVVTPVFVVITYEVRRAERRAGDWQSVAPLHPCLLCPSFSPWCRWTIFSSLARRLPSALATMTSTRA